jgi:plasmid stabilization system protein ParE
MTRVIVTELADADTAEILADITREAGYRAAEKYNLRIESLYDRLAEHPDSYEARPKLGAHIRVGVVVPYLVIYRHAAGEDTVSIVRVVHGRRKITRKLLHGS